MICRICKKNGDETELFRGISEDGLVTICKFCADREGITLLKKPTNEQLKNADKSYSVRERMERLSGLRDATDISADQTVIQRNLARLRIPEKRQINDEVLDNYNWTIKIVRRRKKMTLSQLAHAVGVSPDVINQIEQGRIPKNFREIFSKIEAFLDVKLLRERESPIKIDQGKILEDVGKKMGIKPRSREENLDQIPQSVTKEREEKLQRISRNEPDFPRRMNLQNITLNELVDMKRAKEKREAKIHNEKKSEIIGDEIDVEVPQEPARPHRKGFLNMFKKDKPKEDWGSFKSDESRRMVGNDIELDDDLSDIEMV